MRERPFHKLSLFTALLLVMTTLGFNDLEKAFSAAKQQPKKTVVQTKLPIKPETSTNDDIPLRDAPSVTASDIPKASLPSQGITSSSALSVTYTDQTSIEAPTVAYGVLPVVNDTQSKTMFSDYSYLFANQLAKTIKNANTQANLNIKVLGPSELEAKAKQLGLYTTYQNLMMDYRYQRHPDLDNLQTLVNGFRQSGIDLQGLFFVDTDLDYSHPFGRRGLDYPLQVLFQLPPKDAQYKLTGSAELFKPGLNTTSLWRQEVQTWINHDDLPEVTASVYIDGQSLRYFNTATSQLSQKLVQQLPMQLLTPLAPPQKPNTLTATIIQDTNRLIKSVLPDYEGINLPYKETRNMVWHKAKGAASAVLEVMPPIVQGPVNAGVQLINAANAPLGQPVIIQNEVYGRIKGIVPKVNDTAPTEQKLPNNETAQVESNNTAVPENRIIEESQNSQPANSVENNVEALPVPTTENVEEPETKPVEQLPNG